MFEFKDFRVVVRRASKFDFSVARKNFDLPVFKWLPCRHSHLLLRPCKSVRGATLQCADSEHE